MSCFWRKTRSPSIAEEQVVQGILADPDPGNTVAPGRLLQPELTQAAAVLDVSVVVCAYTEQRWEQTRAAVNSVLGQSPPPAQVLVIVDHNAALAARARQEIPGVTVLENDESPGLSGARNTGLRAATQPV